MHSSEPGIRLFSQYATLCTTREVLYLCAAIGVAARWQVRIGTGYTLCFRISRRGSSSKAVLSGLAPFRTWFWDLADARVAVDDSAADGQGRLLESVIARGKVQPARKAL